MMLYSHYGSYPAPLPNRIRLPDGSTRTDKSSFTEEEIMSAGYVLVDAMPTYNTDNQKVTWDGVAWKVVNLSEEEKLEIIASKWVTIRAERDILLAQSDIKILKAYEAGESVSDNLKIYRQALRDVPQTYDNPDSVQWPEETL